MHYLNQTKIKQNVLYGETNKNDSEHLIQNQTALNKAGTDDFFPQEYSYR